MTVRDNIAEISVDGKAFGLVDTVDGFEAVSRLFEYRVHTRDLLANGRSALDLLGKPFKLTMKVSDSEECCRQGIVVEAEVAANAGYTLYDLLLSADVAALAVGSDSRVFQDMSAKDILTDVLTRAGIGADTVEYHLEGTHESRVYTVQYQESDWEFIERIASDEGIYYCFEHTKDATKLVFGDSSTSAGTFPGSPTFPYRQRSSLLADESSVTELRASYRVTHDGVRLTDYNPDKPSTKLDAKATEGAGKYEIYDYPGRFSTQARGEARAKTALEALRSERVVVSGRAFSPRFQPGAQFTIKEHPQASLNETLFCTSCKVEIRQHTRKQSEVAFFVDWTAVPAATPFRRPGLATDRVMNGPQTGIVCGPPGKELHVDDKGHIRVQFYWDRVGKKDDKASTWMRVGQFAVGSSMVLPRVTWDVLVEHHAGNVDTPFTVSHLYEGEHPPPYPLPANKTRTSFQTATTPAAGTSNEIRFEDKKGSEEIFLNASKDMAVMVGDNKTAGVGVDHKHDIGANHKVKVGSNQTIAVGADQTISIGAAESLTISGDREVNIGGDSSETISAARTVTVIKGEKMDCDGGRTLTVGASMVEASPMEIERKVLGSCSITVGAAWVSAAGKGLAHTTLGASSETVGAAKLQLAADGVTLGVKGALAETVGGAYINVAGKNAGEGSTGNMSITVGGAFIVNSPDIEILADTEISIVCGGSSLTIKSDSIEVKSPSLASPGATIKKDGSAVHHNP